MHDIEVSRLTSDMTVDGRTYAAGASYYVPTAQTNNRMIRGIFERFTEFEENIFYDVSGWTLPLAYDLEYAEVRSGMFRSAPSTEPADGAFESAAAPDRSTYGYVFDWSHTYAPRALNRVLAADLMARAAMEATAVATTQDDVEVGRGSIFVPLARQEADAADIHALMETIAAEDGVPVHAVTSGLTPLTGDDLGGASFRTLEAPRVVLAFDGGLSRYDAGEVWWTLDYRHRMAVTLVHKDRLGRLDWDDYTHLVLVGGNAALSDSMTEALQDWIRGGGTLIATRDGARWAEGAILGRERDDSEDEEAGDDAPQRLDFADMGLRDAEHVIGGAIFAADLDITHPLGFGFANRDLPVHRNESFTLMRPDGDPYAVPVQYVEDPLLSGYASERRLEEIAGTPSVVSQRMGGGAVILMADNPVFRGTYPGTEKLLMNAIFFSGLIDRPRGVYEETD
jgi:hypothetical protein